MFASHVVLSLTGRCRWRFIRGPQHSPCRKWRGVLVILQASWELGFVLQTLGCISDGAQQLEHEPPWVSWSLYRTRGASTRPRNYAVKVTALDLGRIYRGASVEDRLRRGVDYADVWVFVLISGAGLQI